MSGGLRTRLDLDHPGRVVLSRKGGKGTFWLTRGEIQHLWENYRPDQPLRVCATMPVSKKVADMWGKP